MCGRAAMESLPVEGVARDQREVRCSAAIGEPIPGAQACDRDDEPRTVGRNGLEARFWSGGHMAVQHALTRVAHEADVHGTDMQVATAVTLV